MCAIELMLNHKIFFIVPIEIIHQRYLALTVTWLKKKEAKHETYTTNNILLEPLRSRTNRCHFNTDIYR
jgi:hypothetical protein